jgi:hypothetical protein
MVEVANEGYTSKDVVDALASEVNQITDAD